MYATREPEPAILRPKCGRKDADQHGQRRPGVARILSRRRRVDRRQARPEGRPVLRRELSDDDPAVLAKSPLHGRNLFPDLPGFRETVLDYLTGLTHLGHALMRGISLSLGLDEACFAERYTGDPLVLFRIFNYPRAAHAPQPGDEALGVGEHSDYGVLTILRQDDAGGLQVKSRSRWIEAPPIPGSFICNLGDMLDRLTRGLYRSTPHRVISGKQMFGVDFLGGDSTTFSFVQRVDEKDIRAALTGIGINDAQIQYQKNVAGGAETLRVTTPNDTANKVRQTLAEKFPQAKLTAGVTKAIGATVGADVQNIGHHHPHCWRSSAS